MSEDLREIYIRWRDNKKYHKDSAYLHFVHCLLQELCILAVIMKNKVDKKQNLMRQYIEFDTYSEQIYRVIYTNGKCKEYICGCDS